MEWFITFNADWFAKLTKYLINHFKSITGSTCDSSRQYHLTCIVSNRFHHFVIIEADHFVILPFAAVCFRQLSLQPTDIKESNLRRFCKQGKPELFSIAVHVL